MDSIVKGAKKETAGKVVLYPLVIVCLPAVVRCGKKADENKPISEAKADVENLQKSVSALQERFKVCYDKLKRKGCDGSGHDFNSAVTHNVGSVCRIDASRHGSFRPFHYKGWKGCLS